MASSDSDGADRPLIGITTYLERARWGIWDRDFALLPRVYVDAVARAGGVPVLLPPLSDGAREAVARLDGLVVAGGADVDPAAYQATAHPLTVDTRPQRDGWEMALLQEAHARDTPVLGVCRGAQVLNVAAGGTLHQHLPDVVGNDEHRPAPAQYGTVRVRLAPDSVLGELLGAGVDVPCYHHQALDRLGSGVRPTGWAQDGTVEAVELAGEQFCVAVQWHPEEDDSDLRLFEALVGAARKSAARKRMAYR